ncbi:hypothetical protein F8388_010491 [Cannabis sativa]|uniref:DUF4283 domain-containing protein n=1 Tax=Cannabis sativa TaxID=3483 RepID=A0A7J6GPL0_CANSA|nr:hypothetical protein G4B88_016866 [Cannabis sativa]KAF4384893.1 hypothetical protein F8388_010491 [Cannabis sativa]
MDPSQVSELFQDAVQIESNDITFSLNPGEVDEPQESNQVLLGKILSRHKLGKAAIQGSLRLSWNAIKGWKWKEIEDGLIQFTFANRNDAMNVLARRPWFVCGSLIVIMPWPSWLTPSEIRFDKTPMWVKVDSIPPFYWNLSNLKELASRASPVYELPQGIEDAVDAKDKSTFTTPLAKWFQDWVFQKRLLVDPTLRNQLKVQKALIHGETDELRESRRQLPTKKRIVSDDDQVQEEPQQGAVITQFPLVYLPGIGEIAPFGNNSKTVSILELQELKELISASTKDPPNRNRAPGNKSDVGEACQKNPNENRALKTTPHDFPSPGQQVTAMAESSKNHSPLMKTDSHSEGNTSQSGQEGLISKPTSPYIPYSSSILGSQAHIMDWPSKECWAHSKARELFKGDLTVDKFFREPTLFNPLLGIDDFRVYEHSQGPRKRKAMDGILFNSSPDSKIPTQPISNLTSPALNQASIHTSPEKLTIPAPLEGFVNGQEDVVATARRRGRPRKAESPSAMDNRTPRRRGRPPKNYLSATPKSFKWKKTPVKMTPESTTVQLHKDGKLFDLKVDLDNRFVLVEKHQSLKGGLGLCWNKEIKCDIEFSSKYIISAVVEFEPKGLKWSLLGIYGPPHHQDKEAFWIQVGDIVDHSLRPTLLIGDMNGTLKDSECFHYAKQGNSTKYAFDFRRMVQRVGLIDLGFQGPCFTWAKDRNTATNGGSTKRARLDRGLANPDWRILFPNAIIKHLSSTGSDHRPLLLDSTGGVRCKSRLFRYENMWARDPRCVWIVKEAWAQHLHDHPMINFHRKVKRTGQMLTRWNKSQFRHLVSGFLLVVAVLAVFMAFVPRFVVSRPLALPGVL